MAVKITPEQMDQIIGLAGLAVTAGMELGRIRKKASQMVADGQPLDSVIYHMNDMIEPAKSEAAEALGISGDSNPGAEGNSADESADGS